METTQQTSKRGAKGVFVAIEGIDGAGKSRVVGRLRDAGWLAEAGGRLVDKRSAFPAGYTAKHGDALRQLLWGETLEQERNVIPDLHWVHLSASWFVLVDQCIIRPTLAAGGLVIADSWIAKQLARFALKDETIRTALTSALSQVSVPDHTLFIDADPAVAADRKTSFGYSETGQFDGYSGATRENFIAYQRRVRESYLALASPSWRTLRDAEEDPAAVAETLIRSVVERRNKVPGRPTAASVV
jgi:thymidylate kinase